ncbi:MAG: hypothetical protein P8M78_00710 [Myxococcota bacterium]|nr:hypothetical protein [Myxococcota bacterium]
MRTRDAYEEPFDPSWNLARLSRATLSRLGREYLLSGHLQDRVGLPLVAQQYGGNAYRDFSIGEWMSASPVYSKRMQRALGFEGDDVGTVFKNMQIEIGAPPQFMDFQFRLDGPDSGEFWLPHCGALMDVEPFGEERVRLMCHDIEDPTFDATAAATHPRMKMRPLHRPPRQPADRSPHCRWRVFRDKNSEGGAGPQPHSNLSQVAASKIAQIPLVLPNESLESGGWADYSGDFDPGFQLEDLSHRALLIVLQEAAVQSHLLARAFLLMVQEHIGEPAMQEMARRQWTGIAALTAERLQSALGIEGDDIEAIVKIVQVHPCFHPRSYIDLRLEVIEPNRARLGFAPCPAFEEDDGCSWLAGLSQAPHSALDAIVQRINPRARCIPTEATNGLQWAWEIVIDPAAPPASEPIELSLARISQGARFAFETRRPVRN